MQSCRFRIAAAAAASAAAVLAAMPCRAQNVRIDANPAHAIPFDPDRALGTSVDILPQKNFDEVYTPEVLKESLSAGWGPITYRQNTELTQEAWHWNPSGAWSDAAHASGYFTGSATPGNFLRSSYGYAIEHRGTTRGDESAGRYSRLTDGDTQTYWKSDPYLASRFTGEDDALHPQWVVIDFDAPQWIDAVRIAWGQPFARKYEIQYWAGPASNPAGAAAGASTANLRDPMTEPTAGVWTQFPRGAVTGGSGGMVTLRLADAPVRTRFLRIWMTESSNTCDSHGSADPRNCVGYAIDELYAGNYTQDGTFIDVVTHAAGQNQTATYASSADSWHTAADEDASKVQTGFDLFFTSGITNKLPAMIPIAMLYATPEDSAAEIAWIEKRGYPVSYIEMGEEPDGEFMLPEDYGALYVQWARALHAVDPALRLGGPIFTGVNDDLKVWPDAAGNTSWMARFIGYLKSHGALNDLSFVSFEHYPFEPCQISWTDLYREPELERHLLQVWREDGVPVNVPLINTESNVSWELTQPMADTFAALWLADSVGAFLESGGAAYYHSPIQPEPLRPGCKGWSTYGNFVADEHLHIRQHTSQYFASRMINFEWVRHGAGVHELFPAEADVRDDAGNSLVTAYPVKRPDGEWSVLLVNKDASNAHTIKLAVADGANGDHHFRGAVKMITFGAEQYAWHPAEEKSFADPDGPPAESVVQADPVGAFTLPRASVTVLRGRTD